MCVYFLFFFSSRRRHTRLQGDWSSDVCSSDLAASPRRRYAFGPCGVVLLEPGEEVSQRQRLRAPGHERLDGDVRELAGEAEQPAKDERLARHVAPGEVLARVRLGVTLCDGAAQRLGETLPATQLAEQVAQRPGRATLDPVHAEIGRAHV